MCTGDFCNDVDERKLVHCELLEDNIDLHEADIM